MANRNWQNLGEESQKRYLRWGTSQGWSRRRLIRYYESGRSMKAARGHKRTPEAPSEAARAPERFREYLTSTRRAAIQRRKLPVRVMTDDGVYWVRGLKKYDRIRVARHWNRVGKAQRTDSDAPLRPYRNSYVGGYDGIEISFGLNDPDEDDTYEPVLRVKLADNLEPINTAVRQAQPVSFEFVYGG